MTSGNRRGEPICISCEEARERLAGIADCFLMHDREINLRNDDSVCVVQGSEGRGEGEERGAGSEGKERNQGDVGLLEDVPAGTTQVWRRGRGFAPLPILLPGKLARPVLALGAEMKNAIAVGQGDRVVLSPHIGDLDTPEALAGLKRVARELPDFLACAPECIAVDLHPDMRSTRVGEELAQEMGLPLCRVQHHRAHALACLTEHGEETGLALCFDGTGYGTDGTIWGAELLYVEPGICRRLGTFRPVALPGGDAAVREPVRQLAARCRLYGIAYQHEWEKRLGLDPERFAVWGNQAENGLNAPQTHAAGRLFDA